MGDLENLITLLTGAFDNKEQFDSLSEAEQNTFPYAVHRNQVVNKKMVNLPIDFKGFFLHEESYYTLKGKEKFKSDIFLFTYNEAGQVILSALTVPKEATNCKYVELKKLQYDDLMVAEKFTPLVYTKKNGTFNGTSQSMFTKKTAFNLTQTISDECLIIKEEMFNGDKMIFGFNKPIIYRRLPG